MIHKGGSVIMLAGSTLGSEMEGGLVLYHEGNLSQSMVQYIHGKW